MIVNAAMELLHEVGKLMVLEGEEWRLQHPELVDAYQNLFGVLAEVGESQ